MPPSPVSSIPHALVAGLFLSVCLCLSVHPPRFQRRPNTAPPTPGRLHTPPSPATTVCAADLFVLQACLEGGEGSLEGDGGPSPPRKPMSLSNDRSCFVVYDKGVSLS